MDDSDEQEILSERLGRLGAAGGRGGAEIAGKLTGQGDDRITKAAAAGGRQGARFGARLIGNDRHGVDVALDVPPGEATLVVRRVLSELGDLMDDPAAAPPRAVIGAGYLNLNPAVVTVTIEPNAAGGSDLRIRGVAKEGLIKQHAGRKAAERVAAALA